VQTLKLGADDYIQKPCDVEELCDRIGKVLEKQDLIKQVDHQMKQLTREKIQRKRVEQELLEWQGNIELYVSKRTMELSDARKELADLLEELKIREMELEEKNRELTDTNNALATLLRRREKEHSQIKTDIANQAAESVFPLLRKAERLTVSNKVKENLVTAQANLMELFVSHTGDNRLANARLAPRELQVINYIKQNKSSKEIAELLGLSVRTIESYRENIRKKLQIKNTKKTLKKFLISTL
jgi:DNA-binding NarL/FixJ family response regulator